MRTLTEDHKKKLAEGRRKAAEKKKELGGVVTKRRGGSRAQAIKDKCHDCVCAGANNPGWQDEIRNCSLSSRCALWPFRPIQPKQEKEAA